MTFQEYAPLARQSMPSSLWATRSTFTMPRAPVSPSIIGAPSPRTSAWREYLGRLSSAEARQVQTAWSCWSALDSLLGSRLPSPEADFTDDDRMLIWWGSDRLHAELEICADAVEWFVRAHETGEFEGGEWADGVEPPARFLEVLVRLSQEAGQR
jgi:hypothetical protein